jgi:hypothetical protein
VSSRSTAPGLSSSDSRTRLAPIDSIKSESTATERCVRCRS